MFCFRSKYKVRSKFVFRCKNTVAKMNYTRFLSAICQMRQPSAVRALTAVLEQHPNTIMLAGGLPNPKVFPFESAEVKFRNGNILKLDETKMKRALQYSTSQGMVELVGWLKEFQVQTHDPPTLNRPAEQGGLDLCMTSGVQEAIAKSIDMLIDRGDNVLVENPTYTGTIDAMRPKGCKLIPVQTDANGMRPESLRQALSPWKPEDAKDPTSDIPRVLYTIPNGTNPTGSSLSLPRKKEIYQIAREYDLIIMEDDPYYFVQFNEPSPSLLSMDEDGRVLRFDSLSKVLSAGLRVGFVTGPAPLIEKIVQHVMVSSMHPSMIAQVLAYEYLNSVGLTGFQEHTTKVANFYQSQRDHMMKAVEKWLTGKAEWAEPKAGMFLWLKIKGVKDTNKLVMERAIKKDVLLVPGQAFFPTSRDDPCSYLRASFSVASPEDIDKGMERLASVIEEEWEETGYKPE